MLSYPVFWATYGQKGPSCGSAYLGRIKEKGLLEKQALLKGTNLLNVKRGHYAAHGFP